MCAVGGLLLGRPRPVVELLLREGDLAVLQLDLEVVAGRQVELLDDALRDHDLVRRPELHRLRPPLDPLSSSSTIHRKSRESSRRRARVRTTPTERTPTQTRGRARAHDGACAIRRDANDGGQIYRATRAVLT